MKTDFGSLVWVNDRDGREYVCNVNGNAEQKKDFDSLSDSERASCANGNDFIGTDRW